MIVILLFISGIENVGIVEVVVEIVSNYERKKYFQVTFYKCLPLKILSRTWGRFNNVDLPVFMRAPLFKMYIRYDFFCLCFVNLIFMFSFRITHFLFLPCSVSSSVLCTVSISFYGLLFVYFAGCLIVTWKKQQ